MIAETEPIPLSTMEEVQHGLSKLKANKAPRPDNITAELLQEGVITLREWLLKLTMSIFETKSIPTQLEMSEIVSLFKENYPLCANYRPILLLNHVYKLEMQIIYTRIKQDPYSCSTRQPSYISRKRDC